MVVIAKIEYQLWDIPVTWFELETKEFSTGMEEHKFMCNYLRDHKEVSQLRYTNKAGMWYQHRSENYEPDSLEET